MTQASTLIDALNGTFGRHAGFRASHAKGFATKGVFRPAEQMNGINVPLLSDTQNVNARFSVGGGKPGISDKSPTVRGIGLQIQGKMENLTMALISVPVFFANSALQFQEFLAARVPDPEIRGPNPEKVQAFNAANPNTVPHQQHLKTTPPCLSYATERYHSGHAYRFEIGGQERAARILLEPENGRIGLTDAQMEEFSDSYLKDMFYRELSAGPQRWSLELVLAKPHDNIGDPTEPWTSENARIRVGTIEITSDDDSESGQTRVYDPSHLPLGIQKPMDDVFDLRGPAYAVSMQRRSE